MRRAPLSTVAVAAAMALAVQASPAPAAPATAFVAPHQKGSGMTVGDLVGAWWQHYLELPLAQNPLVGNGSRCDLIGDVRHDAGDRPGGRGDGHGRGGVLIPVFAPGFDAECTVAPHTFLYLNMWSLECSTVEPPPYFGGNEAELLACAQQIFDDPPAAMSVSVDGRPLSGVADSRGASSVFAVDLPAENLLGVGATTANAAAAGWGVILRPLRPGTHAIETCLIDPNVGPFNGCATLTLHVRRGRGRDERSARAPTR
jgi:hypothetical protein